MFETIKDGWSILGTLRRLLVVLGRVEGSLQRLATAQELALKMELLDRGSSVEELIAMGTDSAPVEMDDVDTQTEADLAEMERQETFLRSRGRVVEDDTDLGVLRRSWLEAEGGEK